MKACEGRIGRVFVLRLEEGDIVPECIEDFARHHGVSVAHVTMIGGISGGTIVAGPRRSEDAKPDPMLLPVDGGHEVVGVGVIAPTEDGRPVLHMHAALGRAGHTLTGCLRCGVQARFVVEAILCEILDADATRIRDEKTGLSLLEPGVRPEPA